MTKMGLGSLDFNAQEYALTVNTFDWFLKNDKLPYHSSGECSYTSPSKDEDNEKNPLNLESQLLLSSQKNKIVWEMMFH